MVSQNKIAKIDREAMNRWKQVGDTVIQNQRKIATGNFDIPDKELEDFQKRETEQLSLDLHQGRRSTKTMPIGLERQIGKTHDILSIEFLEAGLLAARAVGRLRIAGGVKKGTGVLVGENVLLTNNHVIKSSSEALDAELDLDAEENRYGTPKQCCEFELDPHRFFYSNINLDFTLVAVKPKGYGSLTLKDFGWHPLIEQQGKIRMGDPVNIIHHPLGDNKSVTVHNSNFLFLRDDTEISDFCWYSSDTEPGSSGAPVFNNRWEIVAIHHCGIPKPKDDETDTYVAVGGGTLTREEVDANPERAVWIANEGIRASRIVGAISKAELSDEGHRTVRDGLLALWDRSNTGRGQLPVATEALAGRVHQRERPDGHQRTMRIEIDLE